MRSSSRCLTLSRGRAIEENGERVVGCCGELYAETVLKDSRDEDAQCELAGCGELHLEIGLKDLRGEDAHCDCTGSDSVVSYRETVADAPNHIGWAKSPNNVWSVAKSKVKVGQGLPKRVDGLKKLSKSDRLVSRTTEENGEYVNAGCGELHMETCLKDFRDEDAQCELAGCGELHLEICFKDLRSDEAQCEFKLSKSDPLVSCTTDENGEHVNAGC